MNIMIINENYNANEEEKIIREVAQEEGLSAEEVKEMWETFKKTSLKNQGKTSANKKDYKKSKNKKKNAKKSKRRNRK